MTESVNSPGSVIVDFELMMDDNPASPVTANDVVQAIRDAITNGEFGNLTVDPASVSADGMLPFEPAHEITVNFLNIRTPKTFVVITLKFEICGSTIE